MNPLGQYANHGAGKVERAIEKAKSKKVDLLVYNDVSEPGSGFGTETNRVVVIDGDGSVLMNMGGLTTLARYAPGNLTHMVFDNESLGNRKNIDNDQVAFVLDVAGDNEALGAPNGSGLTAIPPPQGKKVGTPVAPTAHHHLLPPVGPARPQVSDPALVHPEPPHRIQMLLIGGEDLPERYRTPRIPDAAAVDAWRVEAARLAAADRQVNAAQHLDLAEALDQAAHLDHRRRPPCRALIARARVRSGVRAG